jgi:hypothetical protein
VGLSGLTGMTLRGQLVELLGPRARYVWAGQARLVAWVLAESLCRELETFFIFAFFLYETDQIEFK